MSLTKLVVECSEQMNFFSLLSDDVVLYTYSFFVADYDDIVKLKKILNKRLSEKCLLKYCQQQYSTAFCNILFSSSNRGSFQEFIFQMRIDPSQTNIFEKHPSRNNSALNWNSKRISPVKYDKYDFCVDNAPPTKKHKNNYDQCEISVMAVNDCILAFSQHSEATNMSKITIVDVEAKLAQGFWSFKGKANDLKLYDNPCKEDDNCKKIHIVVGGENTDFSRKNENQYGRIGLYILNISYNADDEDIDINPTMKIGMQTVCDLTVSSRIVSVQALLQTNDVMFVTDTNHLCIWNFRKKKEWCLCTHHLDASVCTGSLERLYIFSPGELNVMEWKDIFHETARLNSPGLFQSRKTVTLHISDADYDNMPHTFPGYHEYSEEETVQIWKSWSQERTVSNCCAVKDGVVFDLNGNGIQMIRFNGVGLDSKNKKWKKCKPMDLEFWDFVDPLTATQPQCPDANAVRFELPQPHKAKLFILYEDLLFIWSNKNDIFVFGTDGSSIKRICLNGYSQGPDWMRENGGIVNFGFDGQTFWCLSGNSRYFYYSLTS